ncbi:MAG: methyltransferase domain-containing protein [Acidothermus sp.]|nr:methyltransferase domain-containing protein [Acidothermus sp.]
MTATEDLAEDLRPTPNLITEGTDYAEAYYRTHLGIDEPYDWASPHWRSFFTTVARHIVAITNPRTVLDVGCARGLLVQALREQGIDAVGVDVSEFAVHSAHRDVRPYLRVASASDVVGSYDLITCIEVLEHMSPSDAERAIDAMCRAADRILLSSSPSDFVEPTHVNVREPAAWAAAFAERGFFRRTDVDLAFLTPWAMLFERANLTHRDVVYRYEHQLYPLRVEVLEKRAALLDSYRRATELEEKLAAAELGRDVQGETLRQENEHLRSDLEHLTTERDALRDLAERLQDQNRELEARLNDEIRVSRDLRSRLLTSRDHAIGAEAEAATWRSRFETLNASHAELAQAHAELREYANSLEQQVQSYVWSLQALERRLTELHASESWKLGYAIVRPFALLLGRARRR